MVPGLETRLETVGYTACGAGRLPLITRAGLELRIAELRVLNLTLPLRYQCQVRNLKFLRPQKITSDRIIKRNEDVPFKRKLVRHDDGRLLTSIGVMRNIPEQYCNSAKNNIKY